MSDIISIALCPAARTIPELSLYIFFVFHSLVQSIISDPQVRRAKPTKLWLGLTGVAHFLFSQSRTQVVVVPRPCRIERMSRVLASKSQSKLGKDRMRLEANYVYKAEDKERESGSSSKCRQHCWVRLSIRNRSSSSTTQTKNSLRRSTIGIHPHEPSNFYRE